MSDIIEVKSEVIGVSNQDVGAVSEHLKTIRQFVNDQLREADLENGKDGDYGKIPGTPKKCLLKPGAEKLLKLFGMSSAVQCIDKTISPEENFAMFTYKARIIHNKSGIVVAECEAMANNMEKKYFKNRRGESINCMDILNTLMKMAQKRAIIGATILATGASDYFTQDQDEIETQKPQRQTEDGSRFNAGQPQDGAGSYVISFGKHSGKALKDMDATELTQYCEWLKASDNPTPKAKELLDKAREYLRVS